MPDGAKSAAETVALDDFVADSATFLRRVQQGDRLVVRDSHGILAELSPPSPAEDEDRTRREAMAQRRGLGALRGQIWTAPDFDELPEDILRAFEGDDDGRPLR